VDSLNKLVQAYTLPIAQEQKKLGVLLDFKLLIHAHGGRDNVVFVRKLASWAAVEGDTTFGVAFRRVFPDSLKRVQIQAGFAWALGHTLHHDEIYREVLPRP